MSRENSAPELSVVVVTASRFAGIRRTVRHLQDQTARDRLELVIVAPSEEALADCEPSELDGFHSVRVVPVGAIGNVDQAAAHGVRRARAEAVALIEDHAFPEPSWAQALIQAHRRPHAVVGPAVLNANPHTLLSWVNMLLAYGRWPESAPAGETDEVARHNSSFRRAVLLEYGADLERKLERDGGLLQDLKARGHTFYLEPGARIAHVNPSRLASTVQLRFNSGRLYGATRAARELWSAAKRLAYVGGGPLIPLVRFRVAHREIFAGGRRAELVPRVFPALLFGLVLDAAGQMAGYALGPGRSSAILAVFEMDRLHHLTERDRRRLAG